MQAGLATCGRGRRVGAGAAGHEMAKTPVHCWGSGTCAPVIPWAVGGVSRQCAAARRRNASAPAKSTNDERAGQYSSAIALGSTTRRAKSMSLTFFGVGRT